MIIFNNFSKQVYIQRIKRKQNGKTYTSIILARSYRENGKQKREVVATLTKWPKSLIASLEAGLKNNPVGLDELEYTQGKSFGGVFVVNEIMKRLGISDALKRTNYAKTTSLQILARTLNNGSQRAISGWAKLNAVEEVLDMEIPSLNKLYDNLSILKKRQTHIENKIYRFQHKDDKPLNIYLYDVTSSYFEGQKNELSAFGYNRDKKSGKKQIVIGLLCDETGDPISVEVFKGNTNDLQTFSSQLKKIKARFNIKEVVMVGDKGMIKKAQIEQILDDNFSYITTITKAQIKSLITKDVFQIDLFEDRLVEIQHKKERYVMRRNPVRQQEMTANRKERMAAIEKKVMEANTYLAEHARAKTTTQVKKMTQLIAKFKLKKILSISDKEGRINLEVDTVALQEEEKFDGCYAMKTNLTKEAAEAKTIHDRYKDLGRVEYAFKNIKTEQLQVRPIYFRKEDSTRAHVFICSLSYKVIKYLREKCQHLTYTLNEILDNLKAIYYVIFDVKGVEIKQLPKKLNKAQKEILAALDIQLPKTV